jgi:hypothetical protein
MAEYGEESSPSQALATSTFTEDAINQDATEAMPKSEGRTSMDEPLWTILQNKAAKVVDHEINKMQDSNTIINKEGWTKNNHCDTLASKLSEYGANNILLPPLTEPLQRPLDEATDTPNLIQAMPFNLW